MIKIRNEELRMMSVINMGYPFVLVKPGKMVSGLREILSWTNSNDRVHL